MKTNKRSATRLPFLSFKVVKWILETFMGFSRHPLLIQDLFQINTQICELYSKNGPVFAATRLSQIRVEVHKRIFRMKPSLNVPFSVSRDGLPTFIPPRLRKEIRRGNESVIRAVLTVLSQSRTILGGKPVDMRPITEPSSWANDDSLDGYIPAFLRLFQLRSIEWSFEHFHFTLKVGPNGPSLVSAIWDYLALPTKLKQNLCLLGGDKIETMFNNLDEFRSMGIYEELAHIFYRKPKESGVYSRLSVLKDKEAKSRVFAIMDYWTQTVLRGLHLEIFKLLKKIPMDKTFNQTEMLLEFSPDEGSSYHSIDLTSATDRFPIDLQVRVLSNLIGPEKAQAWKEVMVDRPFHWKDHKLEYKCGQPMGAYSSWAVFALTHHFIIHVAARRAGYHTGRFEKYMVLGDDVVIGNDNVAIEYKKLLGELGVDYSATKTYTSSVGFEFAKRIVIKHREYSPVSLSMIKETGNNWKLLPETISHILKQGYSSVHSFCNPGHFSPFFESLGISKHRAKKLSRLSYCLYHLPKSSGHIERIGQYCLTISRWFAITWCCSFSLSSVGRYFSVHMKEVLIGSINKQLESMAETVKTWGRLTQALLLDIEIEDEDDQPIFWMMAYKTIPCIAVLSDICKEVEHPETDINNFNTEYEKYQEEIGDTWVWDKINRPDIRRVPPTHGVAPERTTKQIARARGILITSLISHIHKYRNGELEGKEEDPS